MPFFLRGRGAKDVQGKKKKLVKNHTKQSGFAPKKRKVPVVNDDEEITSESEDDESFINKFKRQKEDVVQYEQQEEETPEELKVRLAKQYLEEIRQQKEDQLEDEEELNKAVGLKLKEDVLEAAGRLQKTVAGSLVQPDDTDIQFLRSKHHKLPLTCLTVSHDEKFVFTASKDSNIVKWSTNGEKLGTILGGKKGKEKSAACHDSHILCVAISSDGNFLASGDLDGDIRIWDPSTLTHLKKFTKHRDSVSGLAFRRGTHTLFSVSFDRLVMMWDLDSMAFVENMGGHQDSITGVDALYRESCITSGGRDEMVMVNVVAEEKQLRFTGKQESIDGVKLLNEKMFITFGQNGSLALWATSKRNPQHFVSAAHGLEPSNDVPHWITALATLPNTDLVASGSLSGFVILWKVERSKLVKLFSVPVEGVVNSLEFTASGSYLFAAVGKEHRLGRWYTEKSAKNILMIIPLNKKS